MGAFVSAALLTAAPTRLLSDINVGFVQRFVIAEAGARDGGTFDLPPARNAQSFDLGLFDTNLANSASALNARGQSSASQRSDVQSMSLMATGSVSAAASVNTNRDETAAASAQSVFDGSR